MNSDLRPILLKELEDLSEGKTIKLKIELDNLPTLIPITGDIKIKHTFNCLSVKANISTAIKLYCDRCFNSYNHELTCTTEEIIFIEQEKTSHFKKKKLRPNDPLMETIKPIEPFDTKKWIFDQLNLQIPLIKICSELCPGPSIPKKNIETTHKNCSIDPRWNALKKLL